MPAAARRLIRKMRGGAQSHLFEADDGKFYIVKFRNNPQHRRILVNEFLSATFLQYLQIACAPAQLVRIDQSLLDDDPEIYMQLGSRQIRPEPGWHFGSEFPGHPDRTAVFDFVPEALLHKTVNLRDFLAVLAFDKWMANADARQCIFLRSRIREFAPAYSDHPLRVGFLSIMIDHGYVLNGPHWDFPDSPIQGLYMRTSVYREVDSLQHFEPWLERIVHFPEEVVDQALRQIPGSWFEGDEQSELEAALTTLMRRRKRVPDMIRDCAKTKIRPFPLWT